MSVLGRFSSFRLHLSWRAWAVLLLCAAGAQAQAQAQTAGDGEPGDPPSRVARLSYIAGDVGLLPAGASAWSDAGINRPLTTGDRLSTGDDARAELEFGGSSLRMDDSTDFGLLDLGGQVAQIELTQGTLSLSVRELAAGQSYEIDTPAVALVVDRPGTFRVDVGDGSGGTRVAVLDGSATVYGENNAQRSVVAGRSYQFDDSALGIVQISDLQGGDAFDAWVNDRDQRYVRSRTGEHVSDQVVGYQDLDQYGEWQDDSDYGAVWYPTRVAPGWAPYSSGHWTYIAPWGWSWVDDAAWGFAPYHYGRWANMRGRWGWIPGPRDAYPVYAPALVAFVGGGGWSVGIGSGPVGWFPLGPGEIYNPWYRASRGYYARVNGANIRLRRGYDRGRYGRDLDDHYHRYRAGLPLRGERHANRHAPHGFTVVSGRTFADGRPVRSGRGRIESRALATAAVLPRGINARPPAGADRARSAYARGRPGAGFDRPVVAHRAPPATRGARTDMAAGDARNGRRQALAPSRGRLLPADARRHAAASDGYVPRDAGGKPSLDHAAAARAGRHTLPNVASVRRAEPHAGELPSARYARSDRHLPIPAGADQRVPDAQPTPADTARRDTDGRGRRGPAGVTQRPGLSIISRADGEPAQSVAYRRRGNASLPQAAQVEPAQERVAAVVSGAPARAAFNDRQRMVRRQPSMDAPGMRARQLTERAARTRSGSVQGAPMQAPRAMMARPAMPRQSPPPRELRNAPAAAAPPRMAAPAAPSRHGSSAPARHKGDRPRRGDRQD